MTAETGWERTITSDEPLPPLAPRRVTDTSILRDTPIAIPAIFESRERTSSLDGIWRRIKDRLGKKLHDYFPGQRHYTTNGKLHVREAFDNLSNDGLFLQHIVRCNPPHDTISAIITLDSHARRFIEDIRRECTSIAAHPGPATCLVRVTGGVGLFDAILATGAHRVYWIDRTLTSASTATVRFAYESLFDPRTRDWTEAKE